jgi:hypothetical protein
LLLAAGRWLLLLLLPPALLLLLHLACACGLTAAAVESIFQHTVAILAACCVIFLVFLVFMVNFMVDFTASCTALVILIL